MKKAGMHILRACIILSRVPHSVNAGRSVSRKCTYVNQLLDHGLFDLQEVFGGEAPRQGGLRRRVEGSQQEVNQS